jgi:mannobiose 2-epimerase
VDRADIRAYRDQIDNFLTQRLLPFWLERSKDVQNGGFITHFDQFGRDTGEDEKSLIAQTRILYAFSSAYRAGCGEVCREFAEHAADFLIDRMWDPLFGGFYWMVDRKGSVTNDAKVLYGHSFAIYSLSEYAISTGDVRGREYAERTFDLVQKYCTDTMYGGYREMFDRRWQLAGPNAGGGDRKTLDVHMHLMEAFTALSECTGEEIHRRKLLEDMSILVNRMIHPEHSTGMPQFSMDWAPVPQIKFDIVWGWDRFKQDGIKTNPLDNTSYGHNCELEWLFFHALDVLGLAGDEYTDVLRRMVDHAVAHGIDPEYGGVYVEGAHSGAAYDTEKEFWQQCEVMIGLLEAYIRFGDEKYLEAYRLVHTFLFTKGINMEVGEMWPLLSRQGEPIWTHMGHSWKINYHSIRGMIQSRQRLDRILQA